MLVREQRTERARQHGQERERIRQHERDSVAAVIGGGAPGVDDRLPLRSLAVRRWVEWFCRHELRQTPCTLPCRDPEHSAHG